MIRKILLVVLVFTCATFVCANSPKSVLELLKNNNSYLQINNNPYLQKRNLENSYAMDAVFGTVMKLLKIIRFMQFLKRKVCLKMCYLDLIGR